MSQPSVRIIDTNFVPLVYYVHEQHEAVGTGWPASQGAGRIGKAVKARHSRATVTGERPSLCVSRKRRVDSTATYHCRELLSNGKLQGLRWEGRMGRVCSQESGDLPGACKGDLPGEVVMELPRAHRPAHVPSRQRSKPAGQEECIQVYTGAYNIVLPTSSYLRPCFISINAR